MKMLWEILIHTPWWVYVLFLYLLKIGFDASKTRVISLNRLFILPTIFFAMSIHTFSFFVQTSLTLCVYLFSFAIGITCGWTLVITQDIKIDKRYSLIQLPGTWINLVIILVVFSIKYYFGYSIATQPEIITTLPFQISILMTSGICTGLFIGRLACYIFRRKRDPSYHLASEENR